MAINGRVLPITPRGDSYKDSEFLLRVKSANKTVKETKSRKLWQPEEFRLVSPKSPDPSIAKTLYRQLSIQRSEDTLMRTSKRLEYHDPFSDLKDLELRDSITIFSPFNGPKKINIGGVLKKNKNPDENIVIHKPILSPRKLTKNMKLGINKKLLRNTQDPTHGRDLRANEKNNKFPANHLVHVPKEERRETPLKERKIEIESGLFNAIYTSSLETNNVPTPWMEKIITQRNGSSSSSFHYNYSSQRRPQTTQESRKGDFYAKMPSCVGSYINENEEINQMPNVHALNKKPASPPHTKRDDVEDDYRKELFEKPFLSDKATVRNRFKIPRLLINRKCSGRKLVSEFMDFKSLKHVKDALVECRENFRRKVRKN